MTNTIVVSSDQKRTFTLLIAERFFHAICMGAATLLPFYLLERELDEVYFGSISVVSACVAILIILSMPAILGRVRVAQVALASGVFLFLGYGLLLLGNRMPEHLQVIGFLAFPLVSAGWVTHFTLGSIKVSTVSSDATRQQNFMVYAAFSTLGISLGPVVGNAVLAATSSYAALFGCLMTVSVMSVLAASATLSEGGSASTPTHSSTGLQSLRSPATFFVIMVFLQSAIFSVIINFQVVFGELNTLNSSLFFLCWAIGIMVPRLLLGGWIAARDNRVVLPLLTAFLALSLFALALGPNSNALYGATAIALGVFYGLSYPIVQAETVKYADISTRSFFLVAFSLAYFVSYYVTPLAAGLVVAEYGYNALFALAGALSLLMCTMEFAFYRARKVSS